MFGVSPHAENVINVAFLKQRSVTSRREGLLFPVMHENVSKGGCVFFAHSGAFGLKVFFIVKLEIVVE